MSIADRAGGLPEHAKRVSWPEPCLIGGGTKGPKIAVNAFIRWALSDLSELNSNIPQQIK